MNNLFLKLVFSLIGEKKTRRSWISPNILKAHDDSPVKVSNSRSISNQFKLYWFDEYACNSRCCQACAHKLLKIIFSLKQKGKGVRVNPKSSYKIIVRNWGEWFFIIFYLSYPSLLWLWLSLIFSFWIHAGDCVPHACRRCTSQLYSLYCDQETFFPVFGCCFHHISWNIPWLSPYTDQKKVQHQSMHLYPRLRWL